jgi:hypothetical protein
MTLGEGDEAPGTSTKDHMHEEAAREQPSTSHKDRSQENPIFRLLHLGLTASELRK